MARNKPDVGDPTEALSLLSDTEFLSDDDRLRDAIDDLEAKLDGVGSIRASVYRINREDGARAYLFATPAEDFTLDRLRDEFGGGSFIVSLNARGARGIAPRNWRVEVATPPGWQPPKVQDPVPVPVTPAHPLLGGVDLLAEQARRDSQRNETILMELLRAIRPPDPMAQMKAMMDMWSMMQGMVPQQAPATGGGLAGLDMMDQVIEMAQKLTPRGEATSTDVLVEAIRGLVPVLRDALTKQGQPAPQQLGNAGAAAPGNQAQPQQGGVPDEQEDGEMLAERLFVGQLVGAATANTSPDAIVGQVLAIIPDREKIRAFLTGPNAIDELAEIDPRVIEHVEWFQQLGQAMLEKLDDGTASQHAA